ncbi:MAG: HupE/UreJ family protein [Pirellulales bacterium]
MAFGALRLVLLVAVVLLGWTQSAHAHPGHGGHDFYDGFTHPLFGLDHLLAMVAVGLLAVRMGGRALWIMPASFLGCMLLGGLAAAWGMPLPGVEYGIMLSVLILGVLIAATKVVPLPVGAVLVGLFAACHGHAHAAEMASGGSLNQYATGFLLATALLHASGIGVGLLAARLLDTKAVRFAGGAIAGAGALLLAGWL